MRNSSLDLLLCRFPVYDLKPPVGVYNEGRAALHSIAIIEREYSLSSVIGSMGMTADDALTVSGFSFANDCVFEARDELDCLLDSILQES